MENSTLPSQVVSKEQSSPAQETINIKPEPVSLECMEDIHTIADNSSIQYSIPSQASVQLLNTDIGKQRRDSTDEIVFLGQTFKANGNKKTAICSSATMKYENMVKSGNNATSDNTGRNLSLFPENQAINYYTGTPGSGLSIGTSASVNNTNGGVKTDQVVDIMYKLLTDCRISVSNDGSKRCPFLQLLGHIPEEFNQINISPVRQYGTEFKISRNIGEQPPTTRSDHAPAERYLVSTKNNPAYIQNQKNQIVYWSICKVHI